MNVSRVQSEHTRIPKEMLLAHHVEIIRFLLQLLLCGKELVRNVPPIHIRMNSSQVVTPINAAPALPDLT